MKTVCLFIACFLAVALAGQAENEDLTRKAVTECKKELDIIDSKNPDIWNSADADVSDNKKPCFYFCVLKKLKLMNENGTVNKDALIALYDVQSEKERMSKDIDNCLKTAKLGDGCELAKCLRGIAQPKKN